MCIRDSISSIEIPDGYTVLACLHPLAVNCQTFTSSQATLPAGRDNAISFIRVTTSPLLFDFDFDDAFSSDTVNGSFSVDKFDLTSDGSRLVSIGNFSTVDNQTRGRIAAFETAGLPNARATLSGWNTELYLRSCSPRFPQYITDLDIAPDDSYLVIVSRGAYFRAQPGCDTTARFELGGSTTVDPTWLNYSGGDSLWGVGISDEAIYIGGHMRWLNNPFANNSAGVGGIPRSGLAALDPINGMPFDWVADRNPRGCLLYTSPSPRDATLSRMPSSA